MKCPKCGANTTEGQNYCGGCGRQLQNVCSGCGTINPPSFKFCGQCGRNLADVGTILLDRAGLILEADAAALDLLSEKNDLITGKPFSLFVSVDDLVIFYSHWNELLRSAQRQSLEIEVKPVRKAPIHAQLVLRLLRDETGEAVRIHVELGDVTDRRIILRELQAKQDFIKLVSYLTEVFHPSKGVLRRETIRGVLEKIGLLSEVQYGFIARIDVARKRLLTEFQWHSAAAREALPGVSAMTFKRLRPVLEKLHQGRQYVVGDISALSTLERGIWRTWHRLDTGGSLCHMIYRRQKPVGVIGLAMEKPCHWPRQTVSLVKLTGRLMANTLPNPRPGRTVIQSGPPAVSTPADTTRDRPAPELIDIEDVEIIIDEDDGPNEADEAPAQMQITAGTDNGPDESLRVFATNDGDYRMTCPKCGRQETVAPALFEKMGAVLGVNCPCHCTFRIIREMRHAFRKAVRLEGVFAQDLGDLHKMAAANVWGPMVVTDLSKSGLNFTSDKAGLLRIGDHVQLRFYLDNSSKTLIKKSALVKAATANTAGCQFEGTDRYDVTLGFYFL
ncbi:MAG: zinc ribbon domain-containing protein [Desulfosarcina sp.]|nr:zinc ribbon domain-containing protein [Desulfobacterales bacterium]